MAEGESIPRLVLISGATGAGKTTLAKAVAHERDWRGLRRRIQFVKSCAPRFLRRPRSDSLIHGRGDVGDASGDWEDAAEAVQPGIEAVVERARQQGVDLVLEGVHIIPSRRLLNAWESRRRCSRNCRKSRMRIRTVKESKPGSQHMERCRTISNWI